MNTTDFRKELVKIMPGYQWTVSRPFKEVEGYLRATGIQSSGFNRISTLQVERREKGGIVKYEVKSSGIGKRSPWLSTAMDGTLARALRSLQEHYEHMSGIYAGHARALQDARKTDSSTGNAGTI